MLYAADNGDLDIVKLLIENECFIHDKNDSGNTSTLMLAIITGNFEIVKLLIEKGCSIHEKNDLEYSALKISVHAAENGHVEM